MLYPFKFTSIYKETPWGEEIWRLSGMEDDLTLVRDGFLEENSVNDLTEVYLEDMVGDKVYEKYGSEFPILIKELVTTDNLPIMVHPTDKLAAKRHNAYGNSKVWYITSVEGEGKIYLGFNRDIDKAEFLDCSASSTVDTLLNEIEVQAGDIYYIPAGTPHSAGSGINIIEIGETSDIVYNIYDWDRDSELDGELAIDAIDFKGIEPLNLRRKVEKGEDAMVLANESFTIEYVNVDDNYSLEYRTNDNFNILIAVEGGGEIVFDKDGFEEFTAGDIVLLAEELSDSRIIGDVKMLKIEPVVN